MAAFVIGVVELSDYFTSDLVRYLFRKWELGHLPHHSVMHLSP